MTPEPPGRLPPAHGIPGGVLLALAAVVGWVGVLLLWRGYSFGLGLALAATLLLGGGFWVGWLRAPPRVDEPERALAAASGDRVEDTLRAHLARTERHAALPAAIGRRLRESLDTKTALECAAREIGTALDASRCLIWLSQRDRAGGVVHEWTADGVPSSQPSGAPPTYAALAQRERRPVCWSDAGNDPHPEAETEAAREEALRVGATALLAVPLGLRGESAGDAARGARTTAGPAEVVGAAGTAALHQIGRPRVWQREEIALFEALSEELAEALDLTRAREQARDARTALAAKNRELERATRLKTDFLVNVSHELRTPLNSVIGFSEMLLTGAFGGLNESQSDYIATIVRNGRHLLGLINDLLDLSKVEAGKMELQLVETDIRQVIQGVVKDTESLAVNKVQRVVVETATQPLTVVADEVRVRQVLFNLVSNAVKFTPTGGEITVRAVPTVARLPMPSQRSGEAGRMASRDAVWVAVGDSGPGIRAEDMGKLFREFSQVNGTVSRRHDGTGLGLALSKQFVELHGGMIGADSVEGLGSNFWFVLPTEGPIRRAAPSAS